MRLFISNNKYKLLSTMFVIIIWYFISKIVSNEVIVPSITSTFLELKNIFIDKNFFSIISSTMTRFILASIITIISSILLAVLSYYFIIIKHLLNPFITFMKSVPTMGIIVLALIWFKNSTAPIFIGFIVVFPILYEGVLNCFFNIDKNLVSMAKLYKVNFIRKIEYIYFPYLINNLLPILPSSLGLMLKVIIAGEVLGQPKYAIGSNVQLEKLYLNTSGVLAWIMIVVFINYILEKFIGILSKKVKKWS